MQIGWASDSITADRPVYLYGQFYTRISTFVHDPVTVTALALEQQGEQAVLVSCDLVKTAKALTEAVRERLAGEDGLDVRRVSLSGIHTHNNSLFDRSGHLLQHLAGLGPGVVPEEDPPGDILTGPEAADFLADRIAAVARRAWRSRRPGGVSRSADYAAVGFNRRPQFRTENGGMKTVMYGNCDSPDFVGFEGTVDHTVDLLYTWDEDRNLTGVAVGVPCPAQVMELHRFVSADYWHTARRAIRARLGNIQILPLCEAAGDINPLDLIQLGKRNHAELATWSSQTAEAWINLDAGRECEKIGRRIADAVQRGLDDDTADCVLPDPKFLHRIRTVKLPIRTVTKAEYEAAAEKVRALRRRIDGGEKLTMEEVLPLYSVSGTIARWKQQQRSAVYSFEAHFIRIGDAVITTDPFELFTDYSMRIRARAKAPQVINVQLANDAVAYLPTQKAVEGGSYSSTPASTLCGPEAGEMLVERYIREIDALMA